MIALLQRVSHAQVDIGGDKVGQIGPGLLVLLGVEPQDDEACADRLLERVLNYRVFADEAGRMNLSLRDISGGLLLVPQFTLAADTRKGNRPGFSTAADPAKGESLFAYVCERTAAIYPQVQTGRFGADMQVSLTNDGPVTFWLQV